MSADHSDTFRHHDSTHGSSEARDLVWLPIPPEEMEGLPDTLEYAHWDGGEDFPTDPARCAFYCVPYMKPPQVCTRPLPAMTNLRVVQTLTAGIDHIKPALADLAPGVRLCNARGVHDASTAELALTLILASLRGIPDFVRGQDAEEWRSGFRPALADKSVLIVGYGAIGSAIEDRLVPFECERVARVARSPRTTERGPVHPIDELPRLLPDADVVVLVTPLTEATRGLAGAEFLSLMKDGALLVNVSRGGVVDTKALLTELESGRLRAALDVTDPEPLPAGHPLWHAPGVLISPHVGGPTSAFLPRAKRLLKDQLHRYARGESLAHLVATTG
ncbi:2-hydroxyacid dehydrogenase [Streptomyces rapamycinicus]|uniref:NAD-binding D-isomer specific 2-hydroxyacid dehydrogenase n=2 Tax=Streptomyces rapamycinicus TaxID=1226757 RepID=A0A3L8RRQ7_STRRN|nr:2-hydroxyacid dehydrogenase [Streptomyces rapamycinicus]MBB4782327.1 phosphoglycerate dehydrogenase-like enzyme [Streptomyces rapamycinicus]RLV82189.1 NAD-binding D-isomer specific 2-hydroxyacid dehydrogenase [Streptomyces rapamycinicus NRRL 5491]UTO62849.1 2-hydroxyacid dehydrogenase [Streptomyces rapamycinicus]UTP30807.1 2-hydroxyacid dehydrogenase [Streptomyces rapamycinicus NRRL 5491]